MKRQQDKIDPIRSRFGTIKKEPVSLEETISQVLEYARAHKKFSFRQMLEKKHDRNAVVVTFLALLELMKVGKIHLTQGHPFEDMRIETMEMEAPGIEHTKETRAETGQEDSGPAEESFDGTGEENG